MTIVGDSPTARRLRATTALYEESLGAFMRAAWPWSLEPDRYLTNWHIDCMCDYLTAALDWQLGNLLLFTLPPGHMKSLGINVFMPAWIWAQDPTLGAPDNDRFIRPNSWRGPGVRLISLGYQDKLINQHAEKNLNLIKSSWYQARWGERYTLLKKGVEEFNNDKGGMRMAMSSKGGITGFGSHIIMLDDVHNRSADSYEVDRIKMIDTYDNALQSRLRDGHGLIIGSMQRTAQNDIIGHIIATKFNGVHVCLPFEFERKHPYLFMRDLSDEQKKHAGMLLEYPVVRKTDSSDGTDGGPRLGEVWEDKRAEGDPLWPAKWTPAVIAERTKLMTTHDKASQYQQRPSAAEGSMFKREWLPVLPIGDRYGFAEAKRLALVRAWDLAWTEPEHGKDPDYSVGLLMGLDPESQIIYILDVVRGRWSPAPLQKVVMGIAALDGEACRIRLPEDPAAGKFVAHVLAGMLRGYQVTCERENGLGNKARRAAPLAAYCENRFVVLAQGDWNHDFIEELAAFGPDSVGNDDQVDAAAAAFRQLVRAPKLAYVGA